MEALDERVKVRFEPLVVMSVLFASMAPVGLAQSMWFIRVVVVTPSTWAHTVSPALKRERGVVQSLSNMVTVGSVATGGSGAISEANIAGFAERKLFSDLTSRWVATTGELFEVELFAEDLRNKGTEKTVVANTKAKIATIQLLRRRAGIPVRSRALAAGKLESCVLKRCAV
jgi:hypothetical protein